ncbi:MAG: hypothetical protein PHE25_00145 [Candidatus Gracilibacteria bacterium]|nr:hypothetical protein [Candidatus Gracilibacteria bacterium]
MNYQMLKTLLDSLVSNFKCPNCSNTVNDSLIEIVGAAGSSVNLDIFCSNCEKHTFVKAEVSQINLGNLMNFKGENINEIKQKLQEKLSGLNIKKADFSNTKNIEAKINDKQILELRETLKNENVNVKDFLSE